MVKNVSPMMKNKILKKEEHCDHSRDEAVFAWQQKT
jgi:hypothetical protein